MISLSGTGCSPPGGGGGSLTPPTLAPVLIVTADFGSNVANLEWTASNKTSSPGFGYRIYLDVNGGGFTALTTVSAATLTANYTPSPDPTGETYSFYIEPYNDAGPATGGGLSNQASVVLPGEFDGPILLGPNGTQNPQYVYDDFTLTWSAVAAAVSYKLYASATDSGYTLWEEDITSTSLAIDFDTAFGTNWWYVVAVDGAGSVSYQSNHLECTPVMPTYSYRRSGGVDSYLRPGGTDTYLRP